MLHENLTLEDIPEPYQQLVSIIGIQSFIEVCEVFGGDSVYIPKPRSATKHARNYAICKEFNGGNYQQLAKKYSLSQKRIRAILKKRRLILSSRYAGKG